MTGSPIRPIARPRLYEQVAQQIVEWVAENDLGPGDRLPPERELATRLGVSRATVSQALVAMEVVGAVTVRHGDGAILNPPQGANRMAEAIRAHTEHLSDVLDARDALEAKTAELAAERRTDADLARIEDALEVMRRDIDAGGRGITGDELFHSAVTAAAHSGLLERMMTEIADLIKETRLESLGQPGRPEESLAQHWAVARAIRAADAAAATTAMREHVTRVRDIAILRES